MMTPKQKRVEQSDAAEVAELSPIENRLVVPPEGFEPMETAPRDGRTIILTGRALGDSDFKRVEEHGYYRRTRRYDAKAIKWVSWEMWAKTNCGGAWIGFDPDGWKFIELVNS